MKEPEFAKIVNLVMGSKEALEVIQKRCDRSLLVYTLFQFLNYDKADLEEEELQHFANGFVAGFNDALYGVARHELVVEVISNS